MPRVVAGSQRGELVGYVSPEGLAAAGKWRRPGKPAAHASGIILSGFAIRSPFSRSRKSQSPTSLHSHRLAKDSGGDGAEAYRRRQRRRRRLLDRNIGPASGSLLQPLLSAGALEQAAGGGRLLLRLVVGRGGPAARAPGARRRSSSVHARRASSARAPGRAPGARRRSSSGRARRASSSARAPGRAPGARRRSSSVRARRRASSARPGARRRPPRPARPGPAPLPLPTRGRRWRPPTGSFSSSIRSVGPWATPPPVMVRQPFLVFFFLAGW